MQPNLGGFTRFLRQVLNWYAYFYSKFPQGEIQARIFFPYNPSKHRGQSFWEGATGHGKPLEPDTEAWVENPVWDFCSGYVGTYKVIAFIINVGGSVPALSPTAISPQKQHLF